MTIEKTSEHFRLVYDVKGRFAVHRITADEASVCPISVILYELQAYLVCCLDKAFFCSTSCVKSQSRRLDLKVSPILSPMMDGPSGTLTL